MTHLGLDKGLQQQQAGLQADGGVEDVDVLQEPTKSGTASSGEQRKDEEAQLRVTEQKHSMHKVTSRATASGERLQA